MKIWCISDTHCKEDQLRIPEGIDMVIHSGDFSNQKSPYTNEHEARTFLIWFYKLPIKHKVLIAGNHDTSVEARLIKPVEIRDNYGLTYLEHESVNIEGLNIFGSPYTPTFNNWAFNRKREKLHGLWQQIPEDTDILVTHGPPKFILDIEEEGFLGCMSLYKRARQLPNLKLHQFGHIHTNCRDYSMKYINRGIFQEHSEAPKFVNAACVDLSYTVQPGNIIVEL